MEVETIVPEQAIAATKFTKLDISTDGTYDGTTVKLNGKVIANISSLSLNLYDSRYYPVSLEYCIREKDTKPGELGSHISYRLNPPTPAVASNRAEASLADGMTFNVERMQSDAKLADHEPKKINPYLTIRHSK